MNYLNSSLRLFFLLCICFSFQAQATKKHWDQSQKEATTTSSQVGKQDLIDLQELERLYRVESPSKEHMALLKKQTYVLANKAVPLLVKVMKDKQFSDQSRWVATFMLGRIMGAKASDYIAKYIVHPDWILRLASLKTLMHLEGKKYTKLYRQALKDKSMIVRIQALENVKQLKLSSMGEDVWKMLYDKSNYNGIKGQRKRTAVIKKAIKVLGDINHQKVVPKLAAMAANKRYSDILPELDYTLNKLTGKNSPDSLQEKRVFWKTASL